jgi:hypothetical protein
MALFILQPGIQPLGQFDILDAYMSTTPIYGGEVATMTYVKSTNLVSTVTDVSAADANDAYIATANDGKWYRPAVRLVNSGTDSTGPFYLTDDGTTFYGVLVGQIIGGSTGLVTGKGASTATNAGPSSYTGSGKVTVWDKPGMYAVSCDVFGAGILTLSSGSFTPGTIPNYTIKDTPLPGAALYFDTNAHLCVTGGGSTTVARFVEMTNSGGLVQTPARLFATTAPTTQMFDRMVIQFLGTVA